MNEPERRLDEHLDSVERVLTESSVPRSERRDICDEVEAQACEMVRQRAGGAPTEEDMIAVLAELDDAGAYRETTAAPQSPAAAPRIHPFALCSLLAPLGEFFLAFSPIRILPGNEGSILILLAAVSLLSIVFAALAIREIRHRPDRYFGTAISIIGALIIPLAFLYTDRRVYRR